MGRTTQQSPLMALSSQGSACVPKGVLVSMCVCTLVSQSHADTHALCDFELVIVCIELNYI